MSEIKNILIEEFNSFSLEKASKNDFNQTTNLKLIQFIFESFYIQPKLTMTNIFENCKITCMAWKHHSNISCIS